MNKNTSSYYGGFLWLSLVAFIVPVFVGIYAFRAVSGPYTKPAPHPDASQVDHALWDYLLKMYVEDGLIDYGGMERDHLFATYLKQLGQANPDALATEEERLALLCNAYNAFVVSGVINHDITDSVMDWKTRIGLGFFDAREHIFAGETISLNHIEHEVIRKEFQEPRIHMALVCAAKSCPVIRREAYTGDQLEPQLEDQATLFANNPMHVSYDADQNTVHLSAILKWYGDDFDVVGGYLSFLKERVEDPEIKAGLAKAMTGDAKVSFNKYDWSLNAQGNSDSKSQASAQEFGSGSIPNE